MGGRVVSDILTQVRRAFEASDGLSDLGTGAGYTRTHSCCRLGSIFERGPTRQELDPNEARDEQQGPPIMSDDATMLVDILIIEDRQEHFPSRTPSSRCWYWRQQREQLLGPKT